MLGEKSRWKQYKDAVSCLEQILESSTLQTASVQPLTSHLKNNQRWASHSGHYWRSKDELMIFQWTCTHWHTSVGWLAKTYIRQLCLDTGYHLEGLPRTVADSDESKERVKGICAVCIPWWWWKVKGILKCFLKRKTSNFVHIFINSLSKFLRWSLMIFIMKGFQTIVFIFIVISTTFRLICPLAFFRCLSNSGTYTELRTTSFIESVLILLP